MVILDGKFVYADYKKEDTFESYCLDVMGQCISDISGHKTFQFNTGTLKEVIKVQEAKKKMTLSQLYAERGIGAKFRFLNEPYVNKIRGHKDDFGGRQETIVIDMLEDDKVVKTTTSGGSWYVEPL